MDLNKISRCSKSIHSLALWLINLNKLQNIGVKSPKSKSSEKEEEEEEDLGPSPRKVPTPFV